MKITFYIIYSKKKLRFDKATKLVDFIKSNKLPKSSIIQLSENGIIIGELTLERFFQLEKENEL